MFSSWAGPLMDLLTGKGKGTQPLNWSKEVKEAFEGIRTVLCTNAILYAPLSNRLFTDALNIGLGAILTQETHPGGSPYSSSARRSQSPNAVMSW